MYFLYKICKPKSIILIIPKPRQLVTVPSMDNIIDVVITANANALTYKPGGTAIEADRVDFREVAWPGPTLLR